MSVAEAAREIREAARRESRRAVPMVERFYVTNVAPLVMTSFHSDATIRQGEDDVDIPRTVRNRAAEGDTVVVVRDRSGDRVAIAALKDGEPPPPVPSKDELPSEIAYENEGNVFTEFQTVERGSPNFLALQARVTGASHAEFVIRNTGQLEWGGGVINRDVLLERAAANVLALGAGDRLKLGADAVDADDAVRKSQLPQRVTTLPVSPVDGQEVYFVADAAAGVLWHLRYNATSISAYKWEFVGGGDLHAYVSDTLETSGATGHVGIPQVSITVPTAGEFYLSWGARIYVDTDLAYGYLNPERVSDGTFITYALYARMAGGSARPADTHQSSHVVALSAPDTVRLRHRASAGIATFQHRWLSVRPVRVG